MFAKIDTLQGSTLTTVLKCTRSDLGFDRPDLLKNDDKLKSTRKRENVTQCFYFKEKTFWM